MEESTTMASVFDVAAYILEKQGPMTTWKLQPGFLTNFRREGAKLPR